MSNLIVVESHNDQYFLEVLIKHLNLSVEVGSPICSVDDYECLGGLSEEKLTLRLNEVKFDRYSKIGVLVDADDVGVQSRLDLVKRALIAAGVTVSPESCNQLSYCPVSKVYVAIGVNHVDGKGELETLLKLIKAQPSIYADCLSAWKKCLEDQGVELKQKDFDKFWLNNYFRFDTCSKHERRSASIKCTKQAAFIKENIWDLNHSALDDLKSFLILFD